MAALQGPPQAQPGAARPKVQQAQTGPPAAKAPKNKEKEKQKQPKEDPRLQQLREQHLKQAAPKQVPDLTHSSHEFYSDEEDDHGIPGGPRW